MAKKIDSTIRPAATVKAAAPATPAATVLPPKPAAPVKAVSLAKPAAPVKRAPKPAAKTKSARTPNAKKKRAARPGPAFTRDDVALRAYFISEKRRAHGLPGDEHQDWIEAERQLVAESAGRKKAKKA